MLLAWELKWHWIKKDNPTNTHRFNLLYVSRFEPGLVVRKFRQVFIQWSSVQLCLLVKQAWTNTSKLYLLLVLPSLPLLLVLPLRWMEATTGKVSYGLVNTPASKLIVRSGRLDQLNNIGLHSILLCSLFDNYILRRIIQANQDQQTVYHQFIQQIVQDYRSIPN